MEQGNIINVSNQPTKTPTISIMELGKQLLESAKEGDSNQVHDLMCRGAPFTTDWLGKSALHMAAENNHVETCDVLLRAGISKDSRTKVERTPLHLAVNNGHQEIVELLLKEKCDVNARDMLKMTPLHWAVEMDYPNIVKLLMKYGADPHAESKHGETPLSIAEELGFNDIYQILSTHHMNVSPEEQQEATDSIILEMEKDNSVDMKNESCDDDNDDDDDDDDVDDDDDINISPEISNSSPSALHMLQQEDTPDDANKFLQTVMSCGRQIRITDIGKEIIKTQDLYTNTNSNSNSNQNQSSQVLKVPRKNGDIRQKTVGIVMTNPTQKILTPTTKSSKTLTSDMVNKLCNEGRIIRTVGPASHVVTNGTLRLGKYRVNNSDSSSNLGPVKILNKSYVPTSSIGSINAGTTITTKKVLVRTEPPPQVTSTNVPKMNKTIHVLSSSNEKKMVQIPLCDLQFLLHKIENMENRLSALERERGLDRSTEDYNNQMQS